MERTGWLSGDAIVKGYPTRAEDTHPGIRLLTGPIQKIRLSAAGQFF